MDGVGGRAGEVREGRRRTCGYVTRGGGGVGELERTKSQIAGGEFKLNSGKDAGNSGVRRSVWEEKFRWRSMGMRDED